MEILKNRPYLLFREHFWHTKLVSDLQTSWPFDERVANLSAALAPQTAGSSQAHDVATGLIAQTVQKQAFILAIDDNFMLLAWVSVIGLLAVAMMVRIPLPSELPDADTPSPSNK